MEKWYQVMQLKAKRHVVDSGKSERAWNAWLHASRGETVLLLVFEYGNAITTNQVLATFKSECIDPSLTDRAEATAEYCLHEVVESLQERWESVFDAPNVGLECGQTELLQTSTVRLGKQPLIAIS
ncbi:hypothetical protein DVH05_015256 [Phytophthora capsici]|nr:hypothetical protein DVH05_015256 [Phytophthora capsici]